MDKIDVQKLTRKYSLTTIYPYGSRVYGTARDDSDHDFIGVGQADQEVRNEEEGYDLTIYSRESFARKLAEHDISALECISVGGLLDSEEIAMPPINLGQLRTSISTKSSNSWVKCKKKLVDGHPLVGVKSLFHSLRVLDFGIQLATAGKVANFHSQNNTWELLIEKPVAQWTWAELDTKFRPHHNWLASEFVKVAPKIPKKG